MSTARARRLEGAVLERLLKVLAADPEASNKALAERFGVKPNTVARVRRELQAQQPQPERTR